MRGLTPARDIVLHRTDHVSGKPESSGADCTPLRKRSFRRTHTKRGWHVVIQEGDRNEQNR
ncbi:hypothetical protein OKW40_004082 [Paraburkholderia sp. RAU6.4a]